MKIFLQRFSVFIEAYFFLGQKGFLQGIIRRRNRNPVFADDPVPGNGGPLRQRGHREPDPAGEARSATDGRSCYDLLRSMKFLTIPGKIGLEDRIGSVQSMLNRAPGSPSSVLISPACQWLISGLEGGYQFRRLQTNQERYSDEPDKNEYSHLIDAFQYPVSYFVSPQLKGAPAPRYPEPRPDSRLKRNQGMKKEWSLRTATR